MSDDLPWACEIFRRSGWFRRYRIDLVIAPDRGQPRRVVSTEYAMTRQRAREYAMRTLVEAVEMMRRDTPHPIEVIRP